jgi:hypothetical protein
MGVRFSFLKVCMNHNLDYIWAATAVFALPTPTRTGYQLIYMHCTHTRSDIPEFSYIILDILYYLDKKSFCSIGNSGWMDGQGKSGTLVAFGG